MTGQIMASVGGFVPIVIGYLAASYAFYYLAGLFGPKTDESPMPDAANYPIQTSMKGGPIPKLYGTRRMAGNVIWLGPLQSYEVDHEMGGKNVAPTATATETRYRRSFLLAFCEGPATILSIIDGKTTVAEYESGGGGLILNAGGDETELSGDGLIRNATGDDSDGSTSSITWFEGISNEGIRALTGENYGDWPNMCCAFFENYELGNSQALPNIVAEITTEAVGNYFVGIHSSVSYYHRIAKATSESELDTDWGTNGYWDGPDAGDSVYDAYRLSDGRLLVSCSDNKVFMLLADGSLDTSWATNGIYSTQDSISIYKILEDNDGNFHLFGGVAGTTAKKAYEKISAAGVYIGGLTAGVTSVWSFNDAVWTDSNKTRIIAVGTSVFAVGGHHPQIIAIDPDTYSIDTTWAGNISNPGYAEFDYPAGFYEICILSDGGIVLMRNSATNTLMKIESDGSAIDTTWGSSGYVSLGNIALRPNSQKLDQYYDDLYAITYEAGTNYTTIWYLDSGGTVIDSYDTGASGYRCISVFGSKLFLGTTNSGVNHSVEQWSRTLEYETGFDVANAVDVTLVLPDFLTGKDINPALIIRDIITNQRYGARQTDILNEDALLTAQNYWDEHDMLISIVLNETKPWLDWVDYVLTHVGGLRFSSEGKIKIAVLKDDDSVATLTDDDLIQPDPDAEVLPPKVDITPRPESETFNRIELSWTDRDNNYTNAVAIAYDAVDVARTGSLRKKKIKLDGICNATLADLMVWRLLIDGLYRFNFYKFGVTFANSLLEVNDVVTLSDDFQIDSAKIRFVKIEEDRNGRDLQVVAIDDYSELYPDVSDYSSQENLYEPPAAITLADMSVKFLEDMAAAKLYLSCVPGNAYINGGYVYRSYDDVSYDLVGKFGISGVTGGAANAAGTIQENLAGHGSWTWSNDESVLVDIGTVTDLRTDITESEFWHDEYLARIGSEIIAFKDAEETATAGIWRISKLRRGCFGTVAAAHTAGEAFCTLKKNFTYNYNEDEIGRTVYFKVVAYYGSKIQNLSDVSGFSTTIEGYYKRPGAASMLRLEADENDGGAGEYSGSSFTLYWDNPEKESNWDVLDDSLPLDDTIEDDRLNGIILKFEQTDGTAIGQREITVAESETITKATDLGGYDDAVIKVVPKIVAGSRLENSLEVSS